MDINEIAKLAGVSPSTVSKVVNRRDASISDSTRERVMKVVRQYHYTPYAKSRAAKTWLIGVVFRSPISLDSTLDGILANAQEHGYSTLVFSSNDSAEQEHKNMAALVSAGAAGIIWEPVSMESLHARESFVPTSAKLVTIGVNGGDKSLLLPYEAASHDIARELIDRGHQSICCLVDEGRRTGDFIRGFRRSLFEAGIPYSDSLVYTGVSDELIEKVGRGEITGVTCSHYHMASALRARLSSLHYHSPEDYSIVSLRNDTGSSWAEDTDSAISTCTMRNSDFGRLACRRLIELLEDKYSPDFHYQTPSLDNLNSIDAPPKGDSQRVVVVGSINMDTRLSVPHLPTSGMTVSTQQSMNYPGGKGVNEAVGVARLGHRSTLVGNVGADSASDQIYQQLEGAGVDTSGVYRKTGSETGRAFILVDPDGESQIAVLSGANATLHASDIESREAAFEGARMCLVQSEVPADAVAAACSIAHRHGAATMLKPTSVESLDDVLLANVDYLVPNQDELRAIAPGYETLEERARSMLERGVSTVIVTLGIDGCFLCAQDLERYFPAASFPSVDATGAGDAFISALAASLLDGCNLTNAIERATYAAGYSTSHQGVAGSLIDKYSLSCAFPQISRQ